jgi:hypothetical protein
VERLGVNQKRGQLLTFCVLGGHQQQDHLIDGLKAQKSEYRKANHSLMFGTKALH